MRIQHLSLANFRNYPELELDLPPHIMVLQGENAQGKSNLLEAIYLLATSRSPRTTIEREFINWAAFEDEIPVCRLAADIQRAKRNIQLEIALMAKDSSPNEEHHTFSPWQTSTKAPHVQKRIRVNGTPRRAMDLVGQINVVTFSVLDIDIVRGEPALRRRYLDITNSQIDHQYLRQLQRYHKVLTQRNRLLRRIAEKQASPDELSFWNKELIEAGAYITVQRDHMVSMLNELAEAIHDELSVGQGKLRLIYHRNIDKKIASGDSQIEEITDTFSQALNAAKDKELARGVSLVGPHRDELRFLTNGVDVGTYGSRGQQRIVALSLKLAETQFMLSKTKEYPILLLDDVLSELDYQRRIHLLQYATKYEQVLITTTDLDHFEPDFLKQSELFVVNEGKIESLM